MAAYAALASLKQIICELEHHPSPPISLDKQQVESLTEYVTFLQEFLEGYNSPAAYSHEADPLEMRIAGAAYAAEDIIESNIVDKIQLAARKAHNGEKISCMYQDLEKVMEEMDSIKKVAMETAREKTPVQDLPHIVSASPVCVSGLMVGFDDLLLEVMDKLTVGPLNRQVIPIVGMGGIGKTTLARSIYVHPLIKERFHVCAWVTISQQCNTKDILYEVYSQASKETNACLSEMSEDELGVELYQYLFSRRFLFVMDDLWSIESWDKIKHFFPNNENGGRILVTTRLSTLSSQLSNNNGTEMKFLNEDSSWVLFCKTVFEGVSFPLELEEIGKKILENCKGLPLSIVVIGGLLKKLEHTQECWESILINLNSVVNSESDEYCLKILKMSYNHLPAHLKPCFLYMGVFEEDCVISVSTLIKLWISEGFLKPISGKSMASAAEEYLKDLIGRNLILVHQLGLAGNIKSCKVHDLLRELCLREAEKERFYNIIQPDMHIKRRIVIPKSTSDDKILDVLHYSPCARSLILTCDCEEVRLKPDCGMLSTLHALGMVVYANQYYETFLEDVFQLVNLRYLAVGLDWDSKFPSSISLLWNLQTLVVDNPDKLTAPAEIWTMSQLRHVNFIRGVRLPNPPSGLNDIAVMENLQTLETVLEFKCSREVVRRIPNIKKLRIIYDEIERNGDYYRLSNLECFSKLESFWFWNDRGSLDHLQKLTFPQSLKKLCLMRSDFVCEDMLEKIGLLPLLQKLKLIGGFFRTRKWETFEGQFPRLEYLLLEWCSDLECWETMESSHFPRLKHLVLKGLQVLEKIPSEIGEIPTLKSIELISCSESAVESAKGIVLEQEEIQGEKLSFHVPSCDQ